MSHHLSRQFESQLARRLLEDEDLRARLIANPKEVLQRELSEFSQRSVSLPGSIGVRVIEEAMDEVVLVLPSRIYSRPFVPFDRELIARLQEDPELAEAAAEAGGVGGDIGDITIKGTWGVHCGEGPIVN